MKLPRGTMTILSRIDPKSAESQVKKIVDEQYECGQLSEYPTDAAHAARVYNATRKAVRIPSLKDWWNDDETTSEEREHMCDKLGLHRDMADCEASEECMSHDQLLILETRTWPDQNYSIRLI